MKTSSASQKLLRDIYLEAYTQDATLDYIQKEVAKELKEIYGFYQSELTEQDLILETWLSQ